MALLFDAFCGKPVLPASVHMKGQSAKKNLSLVHPEHGVLSQNIGSRTSCGELNSKKRQQLSALVKKFFRKKRCPRYFFL